VKFVLDYDLGDGTKRAVVGVQAQVGWELRTKKKIGSLADGYSITDMVGLLQEQLRVDGLLPDGVVNETGLSKRLVELDVVDTDEEARLAAEKDEGRVNGEVPLPLEFSGTAT
jgi:hypothetical protein